MTDTPARRRRPTRTPVDIATFASQVDAAMEAFASDVSYAAEMAHAAVRIARKRQVWAVRKQLRAAEAAAHAECAQHTFDCHATSPCGVGDCKFATDNLAAHHPGPCPGDNPRPQISTAGPYNLDTAVTALVNQGLMST